MSFLTVSWLVLMTTRFVIATPIDGQVPGQVSTSTSSTSSTAGPPTTPPKPSTPNSWQPHCEDFPEGFNEVQWAFTTKPDCAVAAQYFFKDFGQDRYYVIKKGSEEPHTSDWLFAPMYFVAGTCAFTWYLLDDVTWDTIDKRSAYLEAGNVVDTCKYFGDVQVGEHLKIQLMDGSRALREAGENGNPVYPFKSVGNDVSPMQPGYYGGAQLPVMAPISCDRTPLEGYDMVKWRSTIAVECNSAWDSFARWSLESYTLILKDSLGPRSDKTLLAPMYFVQGSCALSLSLLPEKPSTELHKTKAMATAAFIVNQCSYFGSAVIYDAIKVQVVDGAQALKDATANGGTIFPPPADHLLPDGSAPSDYYGGAKAPIMYRPGVLFT